MKKIFLDANIIIDFLDDTRKGFENAQEIFSYCLSNDIALGTSEDIMTTVFYICKKQISREKIFGFFSLFDQFATFESFQFSVRSQSIDFCLKNEGSDLEDVLQAFCAQKNSYDILITNDKNFVTGILPVSISQDFLENL